MADTLTETDNRLLNDFQRDAPVVVRPFQAMGQAIGLTENEVIARLSALRAAGAITRFGATCRPNTAGASTLAAVAAPPPEVESAAAIINAQPGVNHSYLRENEWNIWFVATGPDREFVDRALADITRETGLAVLDLPLIEPFNIDLGFDLRGGGKPPPRRGAPPGDVALDATDRRLLQALSSGLALVPRPFAELRERCGLDEQAALDRTARLIAAGYVTRFGVIVRHRALGWRANAMVVWQLPPEEASRIGPELARVPGVTLCYRRRAVPDVWPYTLYNMIHGRSRDEVFAVLDGIRQMPGLAGVPHQVLFSLRCFRQTGALIDPAAKAVP